MHTDYQEAIGMIRAYLRERRPGPDERLPSEREFERLLGVRRPALNKAIACLIADGTLRRSGYKLYWQGDAATATRLPPIHIVHRDESTAPGRGLLQAGHDAARNHCTEIIPLWTRDYENEREVLTQLLRKVDGGFVFWPRGPDRPEDLLGLFRQQETPFVVCDQDVPDCDFVGTDNEAGTALAVRHLIEHGHRNIVYLTQTLAFSSLARRCVGYRQACLLAGLKTSSNQIVEVPSISEEHATGAFVAMRERYPKATAFVAGNDGLALRALAAAKTAGMRIPEDLSAVGFDDDDAAAFATPPLTTVRQDFYEIGYYAVDLLCQRLTDTPPREPKQPVRIRLEPALLVRGTVTRRRRR